MEIHIANTKSESWNTYEDTF